MTVTYSSIPEMGLWILIWLVLELVVHVSAFLIDPGPPNAAEYIESSMGSISLMMAIRLLFLSIFNDAWHEVLGVDIFFLVFGIFLGGFVSFVPIYKLINRSVGRRRIAVARRKRREANKAKAKQTAGKNSPP